MDGKQTMQQPSHTQQPSFPPFDPLTCPLSGSVVIEASAGTGKTWSICALYVRLILEQELNVNAVLVLTFTNAAANELKTRIYQRLLAAHQSLSRQLQRNERNGQAVDGTSTGDDPESEHPTEDPFLVNLIAALQNAGKPLRALHHRLALALASFDEAQILTLHAFAERMIAQIPYSAQLPFAAQHVDISPDDGLCRAIVHAFWQRNLAFGSENAAHRRRMIHETTLDELTKLLQRHWQQPLADICWPDEAQISDPQDAAYQQFRSRMLRQLLSVGLAQLAAKKQSLPQTAHGDSLLKLWRCLDDSSPTTSSLFAESAITNSAETSPINPLAEKLHQQFPAILIDEFQDTDPIQYHIFAKIAKLRRQHNLSGLWLMVGDPKQAIYRFRQADLYVYLTARVAADHCFSLPSNQRADAALLAAINYLFAQNPHAMMLDGVHYAPLSVGEKPRTPFIDDSGGSTAAMQAWYLPEGQQRLNKANANAFAAAATAAEIARLLRAHQRISCNERPLQPADIAVLVPTHRMGDLIKSALAEQGFAAVESGQTSVYASQEAKALVAILAALRQPNNIKRIRYALCSSLLNYSSEQIIQLNQDAHALNECLNQWQVIAQCWQQKGIFFALQRLAHDYQLNRRIRQRQNGERQWTNYIHLCDLLHESEQTYRQPEQLWRWFRQQLDDQPKHNESTLVRLESEQQLVNILTQHKAKGLEFPIVFCPFAWQVATPKKGNDPLMYHDRQHKLIYDYRDKAQWSDDAMSQAKLEDESEVIRQLYVALTRAKHRCYFITGYHSSHSSIKKSLGQPLNWLIAGAGYSARTWIADPFASSKTHEHIVRQQQRAWQKFAAECLSFTWRPCPTPAILLGQAAMDYQFDQISRPKKSNHSVEILDNAEPADLFIFDIDDDIFESDDDDGDAGLDGAAEISDTPREAEVKYSANSVDFGHVQTQGNSAVIRNIDSGNINSGNIASLSSTDTVANSNDCGMPSSFEEASNPAGSLSLDSEEFGNAVANGGEIPSSPSAILAQPTWRLSSFSGLLQQQNRPYHNPLSPFSATLDESSELEAQTAEIGADPVVGIDSMVDIDSAIGVDSIIGIDSVMGIESAGSDPLTAINSDNFGGEGRLAEHAKPAPPPKPPTERYPSGTEAGNCLHQALEQIDFQDNAHWPAIIVEAFKEHPPAIASDHKQLENWQRALILLLQRTLQTKLIPGCRLADITAAHRRAEMEFMLSFSPNEVGQCMDWLAAEHPQHLTLQGFNSTEQHLSTGMDARQGGDDLAGLSRLRGLRGFIDLVFHWQGRYYLLDWKSNDLGDSEAHYRPAAIKACIDAHGYLLQSLIYANALHRHLRQTLPDYQYGRHFGGCMILFVRGLNPATTNGQYFWRPQEHLLL